MDNGATLAIGILQGQATAVSDGSYKQGLGTSGFILQGCQRKLGILGSNIVLGNTNEQSSYRSKLAGILGSIAI